MVTKSCQDGRHSRSLLNFVFDFTYLRYLTYTYLPYIRYLYALSKTKKSQYYHQEAHSHAPPNHNSRLPNCRYIYVVFSTQKPPKTIKEDDISL